MQKHNNQEEDYDNYLLWGLILFGGFILFAMAYHGQWEAVLVVVGVIAAIFLFGIAMVLLVLLGWAIFVFMGWLFFFRYDDFSYKPPTTKYRLAWYSADTTEQVGEETVSLVPDDVRTWFFIPSKEPVAYNYWVTAYQKRYLKQYAKKRINLNKYIYQLECGDRK